MREFEGAWCISLRRTMHNGSRYCVGISRRAAVEGRHATLEGTQAPRV